MCASISRNNVDSCQNHIQSTGLYTPWITVVVTPTTLLAIILRSNDRANFEGSWKIENGSSQSCESGAIFAVELSRKLCSGVKVNRETCAGKLISIVDGPRVIYHDSLRAERREGEYTRIDMKLATVACVRLRRDRRSDLSVKTTRVWRSEN